MLKIKEPKKINPGEDLIKFVGEVLALDLDGKREDLPLTIGSFKVTGSQVYKMDKFLVGYDEEGLRLRIPVERIDTYIRF